MNLRQLTLLFSGFGGQGMILSATILGSAAVRAGLKAVQTQSYGSEARGGECQAELTISSQTIYSPTASQVDVLVAMSQAALDRYLPRLKRSGLLVTDPCYVGPPARDDVIHVEVPVTSMAAAELGNPLVANVILLAFLRQACAVVPEELFLASVREHVPGRFVELNTRAAERGRLLAVQRHVTVDLRGNV